MDIIRWSMQRPVSVTVGVLLVVIFGLIGLSAIPIQLTPTVDQPIIRVNTAWPGRSPEEIVDTITREQEKRLKNVSNLKSMRSISREGSAEVTLEFYLGTDTSRALLEVNDALRQVPSYPPEVDEPVVKAAEGAGENAIAWIIVDLPPAARARHPGFDVATLFDPMDREVKPFLERIDGVAEVNVYGGRPYEVRVLADPMLLAQRRLSHADLIRALQAENRNVSAGTIAEGKRDYRVRVLGQYLTTRDVLDTIVAYRDGRPVYVRDVAAAEIGLEKQRGFVRSIGEPCLAMNVIRQTGANVMDVMAQVRQRLDVVRAEMLPRMHPDVGPDLRMRQVYDETTYIQSAIDLVLENLGKGGLLAVLVLLLFLRSFKSTLIVALAIPISVIGTFLVMLAAGRSLNVISLAGLAFSTGMVVDNAIVVLENIDRRRALGDPPLRAVYNGAREVWGAILAGTLTTVAVFIPILTIQEEAGRLFFDLTLALSVSVLLSLTVATTVIPAGTAILFRLSREGERDPGSARWRRLRSLFGLVPLLGAGTRALAAGLHWLTTGWRGWTLRPAVILLMTAASILGAWALMPPPDYLPAGNRNLVFGGLFIPPGLSVDQQRQYAERIESRIAPYLRADIRDPASVAALPPIPKIPGRPPPQGPAFDPVPLGNFFIASFGGGMFAGATSQDEQKVIPIGALLTDAMNGIPDVFGGARQTSLFGRGIGVGNSINVEISGPDLERVRAAAGFVFGQLFSRPELGPGRVSTDPGNFNLLQPEWRIRLNRAGRELGLRTEDLGVAARALFDGAFAGDFLLRGRNVDLKVYPTGGRLERKEQLADVPVATPEGRTVPLSSVVEIEPARAPQEIQRIEELPAVTVRVVPPPGTPLQEVMDAIQTDVIARGRQTGAIAPSLYVKLEGSAAKLDEVKASLLGAPPPPDRRPAAWQRALTYAAWAVGALGLLAGLVALGRAARSRRGDYAYAAVGLALLALVIGGLLLGVATRPELVLARFTWTILVTYLLMCALFESFLYPLVIMVSVPLGIVGGFAGLRIVHDWTMRDDTIAAQNFDVLTMLGFVILVGTVVNNAILIVEQARHFMGEKRLPGEEDALPMTPHRAIAESVRSRVRPIFMTTFTTLGGSLPLVIAPGAGSEMYRGLGAVVVGGLLVSTVFTLILVPLVFSLVMQMAAGARALLGYEHPAPQAQDPLPEPERELEPV